METFGPNLKLWTSTQNEWVVSVLFGKSGATPPRLTY
ncbi:MAG: hypothetical protein ACI8Z5_002677, partial [Lentimonas sp.]